MIKILSQLGMEENPAFDKGHLQKLADNVLFKDECFLAKKQAKMLSTLSTPIQHHIGSPS